MSRGGAIAGAVLAVLGLVWQAQAAETLRVGLLKLASSGPVFIAYDKGYFTAAGLTIELSYLDAAQPVAVAVTAGEIDIGVTGLTAGFYNLAGNGTLKIIGAQSREEPGYDLIAYLASNPAYAAGLTSLGKLPGHSIAITQIGSTFHYSLALLGEKLGFPLSSVHIVPLQAMSNEAAALKGTQVQAAMLPATVALPMVERGDAHLLGWVGDQTPWQLGSIFVTARTDAERRPALAAFIDAYRHGARDFYDAFLAKDASGKRVEGATAPTLLTILAKYTGQTPEVIRRGIPYVDPEAKLLVPDIYHQVAWYQSQGMVAKSADAKNLLDLSFVGQQ